MANQSAKKSAFSTKLPATYNGTPGLGEYDRLWNVNAEEPPPSTQKTRRRTNPCGGEFPTRAVTTKRDTVVNIQMECLPDALGFFGHKTMGGGAGYGVAGSSAPYTHGEKKIVEPDYGVVPFTGIFWFKGAGKWVELRGLQMEELVISALSGQNDDIVQLGGSMVGDGNRLLLTSGVTEPACPADPEWPYTLDQCAYDLRSFGAGSALAGLDILGFSVRHRNNNRTDPKRANGLVAAEREHGDREVLLTYTVVDEPGTALDTLLEAEPGAQFSSVITMTNPIANRVGVLSFPKVDYESVRNTFVTSVRQSAKEITFVGFEDTTSSGTIANSPWWIQVQNATPTYERT